MKVALVVDNIITGEKELLSDNVKPYYVVCDSSSGRICSVSNVCPQDDTKLILFPPNCTLLPGFIDCHVHLTICTDDYQTDYLRRSTADKALRGLKIAQGLMHAGFTTLRSAGDADQFYPTFAIARSIKSGDFEGPRIVGAGHYISVTGGGGDLNFIAPEHSLGCPCPFSDGMIANGKDEMTLAVRNEIKYGSDWIKLLVTGAFMSTSTGDKDSPHNTHFSDEELISCVQEASRRQVPVMAHAHGADGITRAAKLGCRSIEHASFIDEEGINACLAADCWIVPTFLVGEYYKDECSSTVAQKRLIELQEATNQLYYSSIQNAIRADVKVALGSDYVGWDPKITAREFRYLVELGHMTPHAAMLAGTSSELLGIDNLGKIIPGFLADIVVVQGDPLADISLLETGVVFVMREGKIFRNDVEHGRC